jgi:hypothetical protein
MEASESQVMESSPESTSAPVETPIAPEVPAEQVTTGLPAELQDPPAPFPEPETPPIEAAPELAVPAVTPGRIELSTGKQHDIRDIQTIVNLAVQAGAGFEELIRADGKPIWVSVAEIVSYE